MKLYVRFGLFCASLATLVLFFTLLSDMRRNTEEQIKLLQDEIRFELYRLAALSSGDPNPHQRAVGHPCSIPADVEKLCVDNLGFSREAAPSSSCPLEDISQDCQQFMTMHGYDKPVDQEEKLFPLAFGLKMHKSPEQAEQLLRTIYRPHNVYCIHIDKKADDTVFRAMKAVAACFPNVFLTTRFDIVYAGYAVVEAELALIKCALNSGVSWKYYLNVAGQEFPLKTNLEMVRILKLLNGTNDFESYPMPTAHGNRIGYQYVVENGELVQTYKRKDPPRFEVDLRKGSQYGAFSKAFVESFFKNKNAASIIRYFNDTYSPDESVWATLNAYPGMPGGFPGYVREEPINERISRVVVWESYRKEHPCHGEYLRSVCLFGEGDLPWLLRQPNLIANKFTADSTILPCLEAVLNNRARSRGITINKWHVLNMPHVKYQRGHCQ